MNDHPPKTDEEKSPAGPPQFTSRRELFLYAYIRIKETRKWWLLPILIVLVIIGMFINVFTGNSVLPAIYSLIP
ncbi:MAG: DUF5989 family protein [Alphaproteobacteria bacterium]